MRPINEEIGSKKRISAGGEDRPGNGMDLMIGAALYLATQLAVENSRRRQAKQRTLDLTAWGLGKRGDHLLIGGLRADELIERFGSPLFVVNVARLDHDILSLKSAFVNAPPGSKILYSYKTNSVPGILRRIHSHGIGAEVISPYELWLAGRLSVQGENIVYNGVSKTENSLRQAIRLPVLSINVDSMEELFLLRNLSRELNCKVAVGIRLGLANSTQFGLDLERGEAANAVKFIQEHAECFKWMSVHLHTVANAQNSGQHLAYVKKALEFLHAMQRKFGVQVSYLDIGGGYGVPTIKVMSRREYALYRLFGSPPARPSGCNWQPISEYLRDIIQFIDQFRKIHNMEMPKLIIEPGRVAVSRSEILLTQVNSIKTKSNGLNYALTDVGKHSVAYPCDYEYHDILVANKLNQRPEKLYHIVGRICTSSDFLVKNKYLPGLAQKDVLAIMDAGAYFSSYSSNFAFQRPAILMVENGKCQLLQDEETFDHLVAMDRPV